MKDLKLTNLKKVNQKEMEDLKGGAIRPIACWFCGCHGHPRRQETASGKTYHHALSKLNPIEEEEKK